MGLVLVYLSIYIWLMFVINVKVNTLYYTWMLRVMALTKQFAETFIFTHSLLTVLMIAFARCINVQNPRRDGSISFKAWLRKKNLPLTWSFLHSHVLSSPSLNPRPLSCDSAHLFNSFETSFTNVGFSHGYFPYSFWKRTQKNSMICQFRNHLRHKKSNPCQISKKDRPSQHRYICLPLGASNVAVRCATRPVVLSTPGPSLQVLIFLVGAKVNSFTLISVGFGVWNDFFFMDLFLSCRFQKVSKNGEVKSDKMLGLDDVFNDFGCFF